jgi:hypothetical protein
MNDQRKTKKALIQRLNALKYTRSIINAVREPLIIPDHALRVITARRSFHEFFTLNPKDTIGQFQSRPERRTMMHPVRFKRGGI